MIRFERRLDQPWWLKVAVPVLSVLAGLVAAGVVLLATGHEPLDTYRTLFDAAFLAPGAMSDTLVAATPLCFTGLAAAVAFRMQLFNIGGEGQLLMGAVGSAGAALLFDGAPMPAQVVLMCLGGALFGGAWALIPGVLKAFLSTNEIIVSLMLNYVAALLLNYLIFDSFSYWRDTSSATAKVFPQGKPLPDEATWPTFTVGDLIVPLGLLLAVAAATGLWALLNRTRFGFEVRVIGDSPRAARYAGMRTRRMILLVMALSGALAGIGGASQNGDFRHQLDPRGLTQASYGYTGIVVAALARLNPFAVLLVAVLIGGLTNAGYALQGVDFPAGLVGVMQGLILFFALGGEVLVRYRIRLVRRAHADAEAEAA